MQFAPLRRQISRILPRLRPSPCGLPVDYQLTLQPSLSFSFQCPSCFILSARSPAGAGESRASAVALLSPPGLWCFLCCVIPDSIPQPAQEPFPVMPAFEVLSFPSLIIVPYLSCAERFAACVFVHFSLHLVCCHPLLGLVHPVS
ncbi:hypothetical protein MBAV_001639 [Candidatus Magnetobacterium bavaricum]|uniref:Uncharacterized protein n=1 Tax=Candidatus Magnetobacterium bavaricum TaxID=29290 RepID=A0A0F3GZN4_9BACT|nr:hypothetical protein MBAV_001639 [Candidatus Magnetobacterium bavaricum]